MCVSIVDIQSATAEIRKKEEEYRRSNHRAQIEWPALFHRATISTDMLRRNSYIMKSVESVVRPMKIIWRERSVKERGSSSMDDEWRINRGRRCSRSKKKHVRDRETGMMLTKKEVGS